MAKNGKSTVHVKAGRQRVLSYFWQNARRGRVGLLPGGTYYSNYSFTNKRIIAIGALLLLGCYMYMYFVELGRSLPYAHGKMYRARLLLINGEDSCLSCIMHQIYQ